MMSNNSNKTAALVTAPPAGPEGHDATGLLHLLLAWHLLPSGGQEHGYQHRDTNNLLTVVGNSVVSVTVFLIQSERTVKTALTDLLWVTAFTSA